MSPATQQTRVLIVEDEAVTAADLQATLQALGHEVIGTVNSGAAAVSVARDCSPDVILMDIRLRGSMDGIAAAEQIRKHSDVPVVFITANLDEEVLLRASAAGAYGYVLKPFRKNDLNATILVALQQHQFTRELFSQQTWLRTVLQSLSDGVIATDVEGRVRYLNPSGEALLGWSLGDALGKPVEDVYKLTTLTSEPVQVADLRDALYSGSTAGKNRFLLQARDGRQVPIEDAASPIEASGQVIGAVAVFVDITERIRAEHEREVERERLEEQVHLTSEALGETRAELRALSGHLIKAQEEERRRVARELHDDLNQRSAIAEMQLERIIPLIPAEDERVHHLLRDVRQQISRLSAGLREVSHRLHPAVVEDLGLAAALRSLVDEFRENGFEVTCMAPRVTQDLPIDIATALYRIAQEALRNAFKHARGAPVRVSLEETGRELRLKIEDAGPGFDLNSVRGKGGLGLLSMQERARLAGGSLLLRTRPGDGTLVIVRVPLADPPQPSAKGQ
jgi:PAS domain S-box-containing protein